MTEDAALEALVRDAMEEGIGENLGRVRAVEALAAQGVRARRSRRLIWRVGASALAAASLMAVAVFRALVPGAEASLDDGVEDAILVLCAVDGIDGEALASATTGEMLLAWQDAPCADLLAPL